MAISGLIMVGFAIVHMLGNTAVFMGADAINTYAATLQSLGVGLWGFRAVMLAAVVIHIWLGVSLTFENSSARPVGYKQKENLKTGVAATTMIYTGLLLGAFIIYHLLHYTVRVIDSSYKTMVLPDGHMNVYNMVTTGFGQSFTVVVYVVAMIILLLHLSHGIQSVFQSLGLSNDKVQCYIVMAGKALAFVLLVGFAAVPLAVMFGIVS